MANKKLSMVVGLGNMGPQYEKTKHNIGLLALQSLAKQYKVPFKQNLASGGHFADVRDRNLILFWPVTSMKLTGENLKVAMQKHQISRSELIVLHDCMETKVGHFKVQIRVKGHVGLKSIADEIGGVKEYKRIAIGIGQPLVRDEAQVGNYLLSPIGEEEMEIYKQYTFPEIAKQIELITKS